MSISPLLASSCYSDLLISIWVRSKRLELLPPVEENRLSIEWNRNNIWIRERKEGRKEEERKGKSSYLNIKIESIWLHWYLNRIHFSKILSFLLTFLAKHTSIKRDRQKYESIIEERVAHLAIMQISINIPQSVFYFHSAGLFIIFIHFRRATVDTISVGKWIIEGYVSIHKYNPIMP